MNFKELKELIEIVSSRSSIEELEVERAGVRVKIRRSGAAAPPAVSSVRTSLEEEIPDEAAVPAPAGAAGAEAGLFYVTAPIVGTFYRSSTPEADPYVNAGDFVDKGSVLCIIEAMKLMNEIESEVAGEIVSISVENGHPVEYGERLFAIRPR